MSTNNQSGRGRGRGGSRGRNGGRGGNARGRGGRGSGRNGGRGERTHGSGNQTLSGATSDRGTKALSCNRFLWKVLKYCKPYKLTSEIENSMGLWEECWRAPAQLEDGERQVLLSTLARLPPSSTLQPPPLDAVQEAVSVSLDAAAYAHSQSNNSDKVLEAVEVVEQVVQRILKFEWDMAASDVRDAIGDILAQADGLLEARNADHRRARSRINLLFEEIEKPWAVLSALSRGSNPSSTAKESGKTGDWTHPTIAWLSDWSHFQPLLLPRMCVPDGKNDGVYDSPDAYFDTVIRLWVGMTFVDGNNALLPQCFAKDTSGKVCGQPLWPAKSNNARGSASSSCRERECSRPAEFVCCNRFHDRGLCRGCGKTSQERLRGPPSKHASTHIYDAQVANFHHNGTLFLKDFQSRRPPERDIHWGTTKRLSCPNLVGVVVLAKRGGALRLTDEIYWGKVALHGESRHEARKRQEGCLVIEFLEYDTSGSENPIMSRGMEAGSSVAIIDCQTFTPEFVPVLKALERQRSMPTPFENGSLVNINASIQCDVGQVGNMDDDDAYAPDTQADAYYLADETIMNSVDNILGDSKLDPIVQIRRHRHVCRDLKAELISLLVDSTLDPGQLQSLEKALIHPVHCTLGPPGAGKSYLGVVTVRALLLIRKYWQRVFPSIGQPPILVLSYKNHAIDEFLLDLVKSDPFLGYQTAQQGNRYTRQGGFKPLVRIGGGCSEPKLAPYGEYNLRSSMHSVVRIEKEIEECLQALDATSVVQGDILSIFEARLVIQDQAKADGKAQNKEDRGILFEAAMSLARCITAVHEIKRLRHSSHVANMGDNTQDHDFYAKGGGSSDDSEEEEEETGSDTDVELGNKLRDFVYSLNALSGSGVSSVPLNVNVLSSLHVAIKHYGPVASHPIELLYRWMTGFKPNPPCEFSQDKCSEVATAGGCYCQLHRCNYEVQDVGQCTNEVVFEGVAFCVLHKCSDTDCAEPRLFEGQKYCMEHTCYICLEQGAALPNKAAEAPPRNTCEEHPLCWYSGASGVCSNLATTTSDCCEFHKPVCCKGMTRKGKPCKLDAWKDGNGYCQAHKKQGANSERASKAAVASGPKPSAPSYQSVLEQKQCSALNRKGKPCKGTALPGLPFCVDHRSQSSAQTNTSSFTASVFSSVGQALGGQEMMQTTAQDSTEEGLEEKAPASAVGDDGQDLASKPAASNNDDEASSKDVDEVGSHSFTSSDSFVDAIDADADVLDDEIEESEHLQHLREVGDVNTVDRMEEEIVDEDDEMEKLSPLDTADMDGEGELIDTTEWQWSFSFEKRWGCILALLREWRVLEQDLRTDVRDLISVKKVKLQNEKVKAKAQVFEGKAVIGGTMTGCVSRLEAVRATKPFCIIVEEASEVLEPLLFSCLSPTTCKLEMIGDHYQLQPQVMSRFDFEKVNKISISLFERLIRAPPEHQVPYDTLSVQRRMRRDICDLTRELYTDIVEIEDHEQCQRKTIDWKSTSGLDAWSMKISQMSQRPLDIVEGKGREVPGVAPHLFFWKHTGSQERAQVGLSRVNPREADMVVNLAQYLVQCGVPHESIAILTPYKGQLMLLRKQIMSTKSFVKSIKIGRGAERKTVPKCVLSTVDRFQGDEADITLISLVIDGKSRTPFVKLRNRMIVLLSRARIGMFIVGNADYFDQVSHWQQTIDRLSQSAPSDSLPALNASCEMYDGARIGSELPLCCPVHRSSKKEAKAASDLKLGFCQVECTESLKCGHECGKKCHYPDVSTHKSTCDVEMEVPCIRHVQKKQCHKVCCATGETTFKAALRKYECDVKVNIQLPCLHEKAVTCGEETKILNESLAPPKCMERAFTPYVYPDCLHSLDCSCVEYYSYKDGNVPHCTKKTDFTPPCGHTISVNCYRRKSLVANPETFVCSQTVWMELPRCGHQACVSCPQAQALVRWSGRGLEEADVVREGEVYGEMDYPCTAKVSFVRRCGHREEMVCERAFANALASSTCQEKKAFRNPECGHIFHTTCSMITKLVQKAAQNLGAYGQTPRTTAVIRVKEGTEDAEFRNFKLNVQCKATVTVERSCGHVQEKQCQDARHIKDNCTEKVITERPTCRHKVVLPCSDAILLTTWHPWDIATDAATVDLFRGSSVLLDTLSPPDEVSPVSLPECTQSVTLRRAKTCGHDVRMKCCDALRSLQGQEDTESARCNATVVKKLSCGHEMTATCCTNVSKTKCKEKVEKPCWNSAKCGQNVSVQCFASSIGAVQCDSKTDWTCAAGHTFQVAECQLGVAQDCPSCAVDKVEMEKDNIITLVEDDDAEPLKWMNKCLEPAIPPLASQVTASTTRGAMVEFAQRQLALVERFQSWMEREKDIWSRALFRPQAVPIFGIRQGKKNKMSEKLESFELKDFPSAPGGRGLELYEATQANFDAVTSSKSKQVIVFGIMYTLGILSDPKSYPKNEKSKKKRQTQSQAFAQLDKWITTQQNKHGYDAMFTSSRKMAKDTVFKHVGKLMLWEPFTAVPTHEMELTGENYDAIRRCLSTESCWKEGHEHVKFSRAWKDKETSGVSESAASSEEWRKVDELLSTSFAWADGLELEHPWKGSSLCCGEHTLPDQVKRRLQNNLHFIRDAPHAAPKIDTSKRPGPFSGIKHLQNVVENHPFDEAQLFMALELLHVSSSNSTSDVETCLKEYVDLMQSQRRPCHPLFVVAAARTGACLNPTASDSTDLLALFRVLYPDASDMWLDPKEGVAPLSPASNVSASRTLAGSSDDIQQAWLLLQQESSIRSDAMDELLKMVGLRKVKLAAIEMFKSALQFQKMTAKQQQKNVISHNYCFSGNPGTGKSVSAKLFAQILHDSGTRRKSTAELCTAQELKDGSSSDFRKKVQKAMGGVLFIDECYELDPAADAKGKPIVAELLTAAEDHRGDLSIILAGYQDDIHEKLYKYNDGFASRFEEVYFEDFEESELRAIWDRLLREREWAAEDICGRVACRRLARASGRKGFGNAREVRKVFERVTQRAMNRRDFDGSLEIRPVDILGERPTENPKLAELQKELEGKVGWKRIKAAVQELIDVCDANYERELKGQDTAPVFLSRLLLGAPGTGKTTFASIFGRLLRYLNFLSNGDVVMKAASDFVGQYIGQSQTKTNDILKLAKGKVLVIDEAYALNDNHFGKQVLDVLVEKVQGTESDDIAVLLLGYEENMLEMLRTQNPGLARRFPKEYALYFDDYSEHELLEIFQKQCATKHVACPWKVSEIVLQRLAMQKRQKHFGNAGAVLALLHNAIAKATTRTAPGESIVLTEEDVESDMHRRALDRAPAGRRQDGNSDPLAALDKLYRVDNVKKELVRLKALLEVAQREGSEAPSIGHFVFRGAPGTGKTTVARTMAQILHAMGVIATDKFVETSGLNLTGEYVGQTKKKVEEQLEQACGGLLFIDEAYEAGKGHFGEEAMTSLLAAMTNPKYSGLVIIIAGYSQELDEMLDRNAGLKSRFTRFLDFQDWEVDDCIQFTIEKAKKEDFELAPDAIGSLSQTFRELRQLPGFGNGRDVIKVWEGMVEYRAQRVLGKPELVRQLTMEDADAAGHRVVESRMPPTFTKRMQKNPPPDLPVAIGADFSNAPRRSTDTAKCGIEEKQEHSFMSDTDHRDPGVSDEVWEEVAEAKAAFQKLTEDAERCADPKKKEDAKKKLKDFQAVQKKLRQLGKCPVGFAWLKVACGWRCAGGSHAVTDEQLEKLFTAG